MWIPEVGGKTELVTKFSLYNVNIQEVIQGNVDSGGWWKDRTCYKALPPCEHPRSQEYGPVNQTEGRCAYRGENKYNNNH